MKSKFVYAILLLLCSYEPGKANRCGNASVPDKPVREKAVVAPHHGYTVAGSNDDGVFSPVMHMLNNI